MITIAAALLLFLPPCLQGYFDEDSMEEFIASETEESSMSLTSEDEKPKRFEMSPYSSLVSVLSAACIMTDLVPRTERRSEAKGKSRAQTSPTAMTWK